MSVYFIQSDTGPIKIGSAVDVKKRLADHQCGSPVSLKLIASIDGGLRVEKRLHRAFRQWRKGGEWFHPVHPVKTLAHKIAAGDLNGLSAVEWAEDRAPRVADAQAILSREERFRGWRSAIIDPFTSRRVAETLRKALAEHGQGLEPKPLSATETLKLLVLLEDPDLECSQKHIEALELAKRRIDKLLARVKPRVVA